MFKSAESGAGEGGAENRTEGAGATPATVEHLGEADAHLDEEIAVDTANRAEDVVELRAKFYGLNGENMAEVDVAGEKMNPSGWENVKDKDRRMFLGEGGINPGEVTSKPQNLMISENSFFMQGCDKGTTEEVFVFMNKEGKYFAGATPEEAKSSSREVKYLFGHNGEKAWVIVGKKAEAPGGASSGGEEKGDWRSWFKRKQKN